MQSPYFSTPPKAADGLASSNAAAAAALPAAQGGRECALAALRSFVRRSGGGALGEGWATEARTRVSGASRGSTDVYFVAPCGRRLRSRTEVLRFLSAAKAAEEVLGGSAPAALALAPPSPPPPTLPGTPSPPPPRRRPRAPAPSHAPAAARPAASVSASRARPPFAWVPPPSPYGLLQETLYADPWRVLLACALLNRTTAAQVRTVVWGFLQAWPTAAAVVAAAAAGGSGDGGGCAALEAALRPLGLGRTRARTVARLSAAWAAGDWAAVTDLPGVGRYAADAYALFCSGEWRGRAAPQDRELRRYAQWLEHTDGLGAGLERDAPPPGVRLA